MANNDTPAGTENCQARLAELKRLDKGWYNGEGIAVGLTALANADIFLERRPEESSRYRIFPTFHGGVLFEFTRNQWDISIEFYDDGSVDFFGSGVGPTNDIETVTFAGVTDQFLSAINSLTAA